MKMNRGFTLMETMIVIVVVAIGIALAVPTFQDMIERKSVGGAAEAGYEMLQRARSQALKRSKPILVDFHLNGTSWAIGLTDKMNGCNAESTSILNSCSIVDYNNDGTPNDRVLMRILGADFRNITMTKSTGFANPAVWSGGCTTATLHDERACFDFVRGLARTGAFDFESTNYKLRVQVTQLGGVNICVPSGEKKVPGYDAC
jgi:prepilin-type N-terminal cleavage/methylation domain-containing protein